MMEGAAAFDKAAWERVIRGTPLNDPLWGQLMAYLDLHCDIEAEVAGQHGLDDAEAHRLRGRMSKVRDLRAELRESWVKCHTRAADVPDAGGV